MTTAVIHQPNYLPGLTYFDKLARSDVFVLLDNVQFAKRNWTNRNRIKTGDGCMWLTVPVLTKSRYEQLVNEVLIDRTRDWANQHSRAIALSYARSPYFKTYGPELFEFLSRPWVNLSELNETLLELFCRWFGIRVKFVRASTLLVEGSGSSLLASICQAVRADCYLSGPGGRKYMDLEVFAQANVAVEFHDYQHPVYRQLHGPFVPDLSCCDLLMNEGPASGEVLRSGTVVQAA